MALYISECPLGVFAYDENCEKIVNSKLFPNNPKEVSEKLMTLRNEVPVSEQKELIEKLIAEGHEEFIVESEKMASELSKDFEGISFVVEVPSRAGKKLRESMRKISKGSSIEDMTRFLRDVNVLITRNRVKKEVSEKDKIIMEAINTIDELDKSINTLFEKIRDWYGIHFPELQRKIDEPSKYLELVGKLGGRENFTKEKLTDIGISEEDASELERDSQDSIGADFDETDIETIQRTAEKIRELEKAREETSDYVEELMEKVAPNIKKLVGSLIGARLISIAGGLEDLAKMPSSTVQVLGAEKALFRSLKTGSKPPKHGVIFQHPDIRNSPKSIRGKIARALAGKLSIAARVDSTSGRYIGERLKEELDERIESIKQEG